MHNHKSLVQLLAETEFMPVLDRDLQFSPALIVDLTATGPIWQRVTASHSFADEIAQQAQSINAQIVIGRYAEQRFIYQDKDNFADSQHRTLHIGIDLGVAAASEIYAPLDGTIHSIANHQGDGDYGPTIILRHQLNGITFFTLYGHLTTASLLLHQVGDEIQGGEQFASVGTTQENGGWAPHLHLQIINDMGAYTDDFPGVVDPHEQAFYLNNCPNPNLILKRQDLAE